MTTPYNMSFACLDCQKSFKREFDLSKEYPLTLKCPNCRGISHNFGRYFKPPKKIDKKQWLKVKFLFEKGFTFQKIYDQSQNGLNIPYPKTLKEAKVFVVKYKEYSIDSNI